MWVSGIIIAKCHLPFVLFSIGVEPHDSLVGFGSVVETLKV